MKHVVIDLEMCRVPKTVDKMVFKSGSEIIQIGAVMLDEDFHQIGTFNTYVRPEFGKITKYISELTGITHKDVAKAPILKDALLNMVDWFSDEEIDIYTWSGADWAQLNKEINLKGIEIDSIDRMMNQEMWTDYQKEFGSKFDFNRQVSLLDALALTHVFLDGRQHDGLGDAINTGRLISTIESNSEYKLPEGYRVGSKEEYGSLKLCLGDLLKDVNFSIAC